jgi:hypothetical protein
MLANDLPGITNFDEDSLRLSSLPFPFAAFAGTADVLVIFNIGCIIKFNASKSLAMDPYTSKTKMFMNWEITPKMRWRAILT